MKGQKSMINEQTFDKLYGLKLFGMAEGFKEQCYFPCYRDGMEGGIGRINGPMV
jgi:hypothetical protein